MIYAIITAFAIIMGAGALNTVFKGGEKENICKYGRDDE